MLSCYSILHLCGSPSLGLRETETYMANVSEATFEKVEAQGCSFKKMTCNAQCEDAAAHLKDLTPVPVVHR